MTKSFKVKYRYKESADGDWIYDTLTTQAKSYLEAKDRVVKLIRLKLSPWVLEV